MYKEIEKAILSSEISKQEIARLLEIPYDIFQLKLYGSHKFSLDEAVRLKEILNADKPFEELFIFSNSA